MWHKFFLVTSSSSPGGDFVLPTIELQEVEDAKAEPQ